MKKLSVLEIYRISDQCRERIKQLKTKYQKTRDHNHTSGNLLTSCTFYDEFDFFLLDLELAKPNCGSLISEVQSPKTTIKSGILKSLVTSPDWQAAIDPAETPQRSPIDSCTPALREAQAESMWEPQQSTHHGEDTMVSQSKYVNFSYIIRVAEVA
ncbi:hypothetical protein UY3_07853 [Chelonia mydas]|uniref:Myb/SANT-like DNA-binding domain-containing protein n=1 Tax=Chelonia mydas TaxID=8469 RepID=M7BH94_CHEMY|nr:hypothetical protein UY3_07853 [Chelonia mydas]